MVVVARSALVGSVSVLMSCAVPDHAATERESAPLDPSVTVTVPPSATAEPAPPVGAIERADVLVPGFVTIAGWVDHPDADGPVNVTAHVDGEPMDTVGTTDHGATNPSGWPGRSFAFDLDVDAEARVVCISAAPDNTTIDNTAPILDCIDVDAQLPETPTDPPDLPDPAHQPVVLTAVTPDPDGSVTVRGVVTLSGADTPAQIAVSSAEGTIIEPDSQTNISSVSVDERAFRFGLDGLTAGRYSICPSAIQITVQRRQLQPAAADGCGTVVIGGPVEGVHAGTTGRATGIEAVGPAPDHPLYLMERDAGISAELSDGSTIWLFGDTMLRDNDGGLRFFIHNTAAWAAPGEPLTTRDAVTSGGEPALFAEAPAGMCAGARFSDPALWPESAVALAQPDGTDRVVVVMSKVCMGNAWLDIEVIGTAIAEYIYDPRNPPADRTIRGTVTQPDLSPSGAAFGRALLTHPDGMLYGYHCGEFPDAWGPCQVARVAPADATEPTAWQVWNGGDWRGAASWVQPRDAAAAMELPGAEAEMLPVAAFGVVHEPGLDVYLMVYTPWPGFCGQIDVRVASTPVGPWTEPLEIAVPDCGPEPGAPSAVCYAGTPQMQLCDEAEFAGGYYDSMTNLGVARYLTFVTPFEVSPTAD